MSGRNTPQRFSTPDRLGTPQRDSPFRETKGLTQEEIDDELKRRQQIRLNLRREESLRRKQQAAEQKERRAEQERQHEEQMKEEEQERHRVMQRRERECREERRRERDMRRRVRQGECTLDDLLQLMTEGRELTVIEKEEKMSELQSSLWADFDALNVGEE